MGSLYLMFQGTFTWLGISNTLELVELNSNDESMKEYLEEDAKGDLKEHLEEDLEFGEH